MWSHFLVAEGEITFQNFMALLTLGIAEETMKRLSTEPMKYIYTDGQVQTVQSNVDWLTEVVRRLSESAMDSSMSSVHLAPVRLEKVHSIDSFMAV